MAIDRILGGVVRSLLCVALLLSSSGVIAEKDEQERWKLDALLSYSTLYVPSAQIGNEEDLVRYGISLSPEDGKELAFTQERKIAILSNPLLSQGRFLYKKTDGICWVITEPFPAILEITPNAVKQINSDGVAQIMEAGSNPIVSELTQVFSAIFSGDMGSVLSVFDVYLLRDKPEHMPVNGWMLGLKPKNSALVGVPSEIRLIGGRELRWVTFSNKSGDSTRIEFAQPKSHDDIASVRCFEESK